MTRKKRQNTGKAVFDMEFAMLHQQREVDILRAGVDNLRAGMGEQRTELGEVTRMLREQHSLIVRLLAKDSAQVWHTTFHLTFHVWVASNVRQLDGDGW